MKKLKQKKRLTSLLLATTMLLGIMNTGVSHAASDE
ncbi:sphingomyelin phosphodiesterase, partial [Staphylococcus pseudintermedius]|nr:sphingomyelin phosphodiesterase [Staphylococcus pseudintermedius]